MTQKEMILKHLQEHPSITSAEAMNRYGIYRLASRIWDLRNDGYNIVSEKVTQKNRFGKAVHFDRYSICNSGGICKPE